MRTFEVRIRGQYSYILNYLCPPMFAMLPGRTAGGVGMKGLQRSHRAQSAQNVRPISKLVFGCNQTPATQRVVSNLPSTTVQNSRLQYSF